MSITSYVEESPTKRSLSLEIPLEQVLAATEKAARTLARQVRLPGFRPGKVPPAIVKKRFADDLKSEVLESLLRQTLHDAFHEKGIVPVGEPKIDDLKFEADAPLTFKVEVEHRPTVAPKDYRGLKVPTDPVIPTDEEVAEKLGITLDEYLNLLGKLSLISLVALDELWNVGGDKGDKVSLVDTLEDSRVKDPSKTYEIEEMRRILAEAINRLPEREKIVISLYYYEGLTLREIGEVLGVTESRVCQMHTKAILRLKGRLTSAKGALEV